MSGVSGGKDSFLLSHIPRRRLLVTGNARHCYSCLMPLKRHEVQSCENLLALYRLKLFCGNYLVLFLRYDLGNALKFLVHGQVNQDHTHCIAPCFPDFCNRSADHLTT